jgi:Rab-like protein 3
MQSVTDIAKVRILVVGDSGTGKTCLVHKLCHGTPLLHPSWTIGCSIDMKFFDYKAGGTTRRFFLEFWDVGGHRKYEHSRDVFYTQMNGIILTFDLTNHKSYKNLRKWIRELVRSDRKKGIEEKYIHREPLRNGNSLGALPVILVGNKKDAHDGRQYENMKDFGLDCVTLSALGISDDTNQLNSFFNKVIERRYYRSRSQIMSPQSSIQLDRSLGRVYLM